MRKCHPLPPAQSLWELFSYDPLKGCLIHRIGNPKRYIGSKAGCFDKVHGYSKVRVHGKYYFEHRLIYKWVTGKDPEGVIDHVNQEKSKVKYNAFHALEVVSDQVNIVRSKRKNRKDKLPTGVTFSGKSYQAKIGIFRRNINLGSYKTAEQANKAYISASQCLSCDPNWLPDSEFFTRHERLWGYSMYKGVSFSKKAGKWRAQLMDPTTKKVKHIGVFNTEKEAADRINQLLSER